MEKENFILQKIENRNFSKDECFLCCPELNNSNSTVEHVIPKWLQKKYNLWDQKITLINGSNLFYRNLTIPCCFNCNNKFLQPLENRIKKALELGIEELKKVSEVDLFLWLSKIYFGIIYKELFLKSNIKDPNSSTIVSPEKIDSLFMHYLFLQKIHLDVGYRNFFPASIYFFETQESELDKWDLIDNHNSLFISLRMGNIGIIAALQDCGKTKTIAKHLDKYKKIVLHPFQFRELSGKILYKLMLEKDISKFYFGENIVTRKIEISKIGGPYNTSLFNEWDNEEYSALLSILLGLDQKLIYENGNLYTWLEEDSGEPKYINIETKIK